MGGAAQAAVRVGQPEGAPVAIGILRAKDAPEAWLHRVAPGVAGERQCPHAGTVVAAAPCDHLAPTRHEPSHLDRILDSLGPRQAQEEPVQPLRSDTRQRLSQRRLGLVHRGRVSARERAGLRHHRLDNPRLAVASVAVEHLALEVEPARSRLVPENGAFPMCDRHRAGRLLGGPRVQDVLALPRFEIRARRAHWLTSP